jgi:galactose mutarotase-like enzyme
MAAHAIEETTHEGFPAVELSSPDGVRATYAPSIGMVGCSLRYGEDELLAQRGGLPKYNASGSTFGIPLLYPWANRLAGWSYEAAGKRVELDTHSPLIRTDPNGLPIHGLLAASRHWTVTGEIAADDRAQLSATLDFAARPDLLAAFPFPHELRIDVALAGRALTVTTTVTATGDSPVPVSFGYHPYLTLPGVPRDEWELEIPVRRHLVLDDVMIPTGATEPTGDLNGPLNGRAFDDGYAELMSPPVFALSGGGRRIEVEFGTGYPYAQVYSPADQALLCFEPMTAPTNALEHGTGLPMAEPGGSYSATFEIRI